MAITLRDAGTWEAITASAAVTLPTHQEGDMLIVRVAMKSSNAASETIGISTGGWTKIGQGNNGTTNASNGGGSVLVAAFFKIATSSSETNPTVTFTAVNIAGVVAMAYQKAAGEIWMTPVGNSGPDTTSNTAVSATIASHIATKVGDLVDFFTGVADDTTMTVPTFTQTGLTLNTVTESPAAALSSTSGFDIAADGGYRIATAGISSAAAVVTGTLSTAETNTSWTTRLRVVGPATGQAQAQIKAFGVKGYGQAQAQIKAFGVKGYGQANVRVVGNNTIFEDQFNRVNAVDLNTADSGHSYVVQGGTPNGTVNGSAAFFDGSLTAATNYDIPNAGLVEVAGIEITAKIKFSAHSGTNRLFIGPSRSTGIGNGFVLSSSTANLLLQEVSNSTGVGATLASIASPATDTYYNVKVQVIPTSPDANSKSYIYRAALWLDGGTEPGLAETAPSSSLVLNTMPLTNLRIRHVPSGNVNATVDYIKVTFANLTRSAQAQASIVNTRNSSGQAQAFITELPLAFTEYYNGRDASNEVNPTLDVTGVNWVPGDLILVLGTGREDAAILTSVTDNGPGETFTIEQSYNTVQGVLWGGIAWAKAEGTGTNATITLQVTEDNYVNPGGYQASILVIKKAIIDDFSINETGATDTDAPSVDHTTIADVTRVFYLFNTRQRAFTPDGGDGLTVIRNGTQASSGGGISSVWLYTKEESSAGSKNASGTTTGGALDWLALAVSVTEDTGLETYRAHAQANAWIENTYNGLGQAQGTILQTYFGLGQAQAQIKQVYYVHGQAEAWIKSTYRGHGQAEAKIKAFDVNRHGQARASIKATTSRVGQAKARIGTELLVYAQDTFTRDETDQFGTADSGQTWISATGSNYDVVGGQGVITNLQTGEIWLEMNSPSQSVYFQFKLDQPLDTVVTGSAFEHDTYLPPSGTGIFIRLNTDKTWKVWSSLAGLPGTDTGITFDHTRMLNVRIYHFNDFQPGSPTESLRVIKAKIWYEGEQEPEWQLVVVDFVSLTLTQQRIRFDRAYFDATQFQANPTYYIDNVNVYDPVDTLRHAQAQAQIKQTYIVTGQAQAYIVRQEYGLGQAQAWIENTYNGLGQAQGQIKQVYFSLGQTQAQIKQVYTGLGQAQAQIKQAYNGLGQAQAWIETTYNQHGQAQAQIKQAYNGLGQAQAQIKQIYTGLGQAQADIKQTYYALGQANAWIEQTYYGLGQAQGTIRTTYYAHGQAQASILQRYNQHGQAQAQVKTTYFALAQAQALIANVYTVYGQTQAKINAFGVNQYGQAQANILFTGNAVHGQAQAKINAFDYNQHGQAQGWIETTTNSVGQAQGSIRQVYNVHGQSQAWIENSYNGLGQAQGAIKTTYYNYGQAQAYIIRVDQNGYGQAQAQIKQVYYVHGQANAKINAFGVSAHGQAEAYVLAGKTAHGQAQGTIKAAGYGVGQAQGTIKTTYNSFGQAQANIKQVYYAHGQANSLIAQTAFGTGQAQSSIKAVSAVVGQAQGWIEATVNIHGQAQARIKNIYSASGQANAYIYLVQFGLGQAQALILAKSNQTGQAQGSILQTYRASAQAQARVKATYAGTGQAQAVVLNRYSATGQAQAAIFAGGFQHGQAQAQIILIGQISVAQAQATIIKAALYGQAQALITNPHTLKNLTLEDDRPIITRLEDEANSLALVDEQEEVEITVQDDIIIVTIVDEAVLGLFIDDEAF